MEDIVLRINKFVQEERETKIFIEDLKKKLLDIKESKRLLVLNYIKEWIIINQESLNKSNIGFEMNNDGIKIIGFADSNKDINSFKIVITVENDDLIYLVSSDENTRYWENEHYIFKSFSYKRVSDVILYLKKNLPVRINYRKQRSENELYKQYKAKNIW